MGESERGGRKSKLKLISYSYSPHLHYGQDISGKGGEIPDYTQYSGNYVATKYIDQTAAPKNVGQKAIIVFK